MKKFSLITLSILCLTFLSVSATFAAGQAITFSAGSSFSAQTETTSADIITPVVSGMKDLAMQDELNKKFAVQAQEMIGQYEQDVQDIQTEVPGSDPNKPRFAMGFGYEVVAESDFFLTFATVQTYVAASFSASYAYYNFDKMNGTLVTFESLVDDPDVAIQTLSDYIREEMKKANQANTAYYFIDEYDSLAQAMNLLVENNHWYLNNNGNLVVHFDKYEVAPGAQGPSDFIIPDEIFYLISGN